MIIEAILKLVFGAITWLLNLLPAFSFEVGSIPSLEFLGTIRLYLNYFLTPVTASILINILLFAPMSLLVWGIIKLIRYFLPVLSLIATTGEFMEAKHTLLENPNYVFWRKFSSRLSFATRQKIKNTTFPKILEFIKWVLVDLQRPRYYHPYGLFFYVGLPGTGKTIYMTYELNKLREKYGNSIYIGTNYGFIGQDFEVNGYEDIIKLRDKPTIIGYDEIQNDFDARNWANLDSAFSERITQSRKMEGLMILATAQRFGFVDKRLRELTHTVHKCSTLVNRLTIARLYEPKMIDKLEEGQYSEVNTTVSKGFKYFVQSDNIRSLYSSYQILENVKKRMELREKSAKQSLSDISTIVGNYFPVVDN